MFLCKFCLKEFKNKSGLTGHELRSHINLNKQKEYAKKGSKRIKELYPNGTFNGRKHTIKTKERMSEIRVVKLNHKAFYSKRVDYNGTILDSSYEFKLAKSLDDNNVKWIRPKSLKWNDDGQIRRYIPDFYLPDYDVYLDPKNDFLIKKDKRKIHLTEQFNDVTILVLNKNQLEWKFIKSLLR